MTSKERAEYEREALPIKFGSSLYSKLNKKYWELDHCKDLPLVLFIEAFHDENSLAFSDNALASYLYGLRSVGEWDKNGKLVVKEEEIETHKIAGKEIPSNFFGLPDSENISAVVFTNSGTLAKFSRMGFMHGYGNETYKLIRSGVCFNYEPSAMDSSMFRYDLEQPPHIESWGDGLTVFMNPSAKRPLPEGYFGDVTYYALTEDRLSCKLNGWSAITSSTQAFYLNEAKSVVEPLYLGTPGMINAITRQEFAVAVSCTHTDHPRFEEDGWFADYADGFYGVVIKLKASENWGYFILSRSIYAEMKTIKQGKPSFDFRKDAVHALQSEMLLLSIRPRRYFRD